MKKRKIHFIEAAMRYKQVTLVSVSLLLILGLYALMGMPRSENPKIDMPVAMVYAFYPGADELQTEKQVTRKIEQYLFSFEEIDKKKTTSQTRDGQVFITAYINTWVKDRKKFWSTLQHGLNVNMPQVLPQGVIGPGVNSNFGDVTAQIITVSSNQRSYAEIETYLDKIEDGLKVIPEVSKINRAGGQKQQIYITVDDRKMQQYGFDISAVISVLRAQNITSYSGEMTVKSNTMPVFTNSRFKTEDDIAGQIVYTTPAGVVVRLRDIANIERRYEEPSSFIRVGEDKVMILSIEMQPGNNIVRFGEKVQHRLDEVQRSFPGDIKINTIVNQPEVVGESIRHFMKEFGIAIAAVIIVVMLLLPFRVAAVASIAAPVSIIITFGIINIMGIELHQVTLAALIIVLGMVVDNAIVVVDNYIEKIDEGLTPWTGAWQAARQLALPIFTATLAIIFAFAPLALFMTGIAKDFIAALPVTVAVALIVSMLVALLVTPYTCYIFIKKGLKHKISERPGRRSLLDRLQHAFNIGIEGAFRWPKMVIAAAMLAIAGAVVLAGRVSQEFFPLSESKQFNAEIWMPSGTSLEETEKVVRRVEEELKKDSRVVGIASFVGTSSPRFNITYAPEPPRRNYAQVFITTTSADATNELVKKYLPIFDGFVSDGNVRLRQLSLQEGAPLAIRVIGENINDQKRVAEQVKVILQNARGTNWVRTDYEEDYLGISLKVKDDIALRYGVPGQAITQMLGAGLKGYAVSQLWEGDKPVDLFLRLDAANRKDFADLGNLHVHNSYGAQIPLKEVADLTPSWHTGVIAHRNGLRTLTVLSEAQLGIRASDILSQVKPQIERISLPDGVRIAYGGDAESSEENAPGMATALGCSLVLIFVTLLFQFKSFGKTLIVLATFPLSLLGAMLGLLITGNPMGFTAFMGIISLIGIVVRNGIILVDYADELVRDHGYTARAAALAAAKRRMRPIFLTSAAAAVGVIPMIAGKSPLWAPLGSVLAFGLIVSMILTLFVIPVLYNLFVRPGLPGAEAPDADREIQYKPGHIKGIAMIVMAVALAVPFAGKAQPSMLSLEDCRKMALEQNRKIKAAQYEIDAARAANEAARLNNRPSFDVSITGAYVGKPISDLLPSVLGNASLDIKQPIYTGGKIKLAREATAKSIEIYEGRKSMTEAEVLLAAETAYWQVVQVKERIILAGRYAEMLRGLQRDLQNSYDAGLIYKNDLLRVEVSLNEAGLNITRANDGLVMAKLNLAQLIGRPCSTDFLVPDSVGGHFDRLPETNFDVNAEKRPEINVLQKAIEAEKIQAKLIRADLSPTIGASASGIGAAGSKINFSNGRDYLLTYYGLVNVSIPLFDWGKNARKVKEQNLKVRAQQEQLENAREQVNLEVQNAWLQVNQSVRKIDVTTLSLHQADENLRLANDRLKAGTIVGKDVLEAQAIWQQAFAGVIDARVEYKISQANYRKAVGELK